MVTAVALVIAVVRLDPQPGNLHTMGMIKKKKKKKRGRKLGGNLPQGSCDGATNQSLGQPVLLYKTGGGG